MLSKTSTNQYQHETVPFVNKVDIYGILHSIQCDMTNKILVPSKIILYFQNDNMVL
jgi:hypothetical protein